ncbi:MAG: hypothetical protein AAB935_00795, partial [Patescibacteria group bacterium]
MRREDVVDPTEFSKENERWICLNCGTPNPDGGSKCPNCDSTIEPLPAKLSLKAFAICAMRDL